MTKEQWGALQDGLCKTVGRNNYATWIKPLTYKGSNDGVAVFNVPSNFMGTYVSQNFGELLLSQISSVASDVRRIQFKVAEEMPMRKSPSPKAQVMTGPTDILSSAPLDSRFTFDTFVVGKPNELAHAAARRVAEGGPVTFNPLFLYGGVGLGKTHLMHAISW